ncbi:regulator of volume decrease after cellular swelling-domain-containing protein [Kickxella alabastrina]|uniref:regulator of volume decrease after cellular swelling-domain-containing protein n=1 Tax=Kickxella alabastrina TaxID=61397 RepID=UPI0022210DF1|nr:regulator of volume decrease after cellular swelling-domain-containing protein [Kickxella alabastrina]KAI7821650.1 regulator of volume decrease after cellular swelling-domain-containing protein [Kickxella alabastrina]
MTVTPLRQPPNPSTLSSTAQLTVPSTRFLLATNNSNVSEAVTGTLYINHDSLVFYSDQQETSFGFSIDYPAVVIHAVSHEPPAHLYCQLDGPFPQTIAINTTAAAAATTASKDDTNEDEDEDEFAEIKFFPQNPQILDDMFKAMSECAAMNPDHDQEALSDNDIDDGHGCHRERDNEGDGSVDGVQTIAAFDPADFITCEDQLDQLTAKGKTILAHLEALIAAPDTTNSSSSSADRFTDAD